jgi:hypothetical protein
MRRILLLFVLPLAVLWPTIATAKLFLPQHPVGFEPLASEHPEEAALAWRDANYLTSDRLFPILTDELEIQRQLRAHRMPLWNGKQALGLPLAGGTIVGPFYPPNWIAYATDPVRAAPWLAMLSLFLLGLGSWLFLERRGLSFGACAIGAIAAQASGFALANLHYRMKVDAIAWLPWILWSIEGLRASSKRRASSALWLFASTALAFLAGFPSIAIFAVAASLLYLAARRFVDREKELLVVRAVLSIACGVAAAAPQLWPTLETSRWSMRTSQSADDLRAESLPLATALSIVAPDLFGSPNERVFAPHLPAAWWLTRKSESYAAENANLLEWNLFSGALVAALAVAALVASFRATRSIALVALVALGFAQGWPLIRWAYSLPGFDLGAPSRAAAVLACAIALLSGFGAQAILERKSRAFAAAIAVAAACAIGGALATFAIEPKSFAASQEAALAARHGVTLGEVRELLPSDVALAAAERWKFVGERVAIVAVAGLVALFAARLVARREFAWSFTPLFAVIAAESASFARPHLAPREPFELFPSSPAMDAIARAAGDGRVVRLDESSSGIDDVLALARPNLPEVYGVADLTPYVVFSQRSLVELVAAIDPIATYRSGISRISYPALCDHRALDSCRVTAVLSHSAIASARLEPVLERDGFHVYRRACPIGEARVVGEALAAKTVEQELGHLRQQTVDPSRGAVLAPGEAFQPRPRDGESAGRVVDLRDDRAGEIDCTVEAPRGGLLVFSVAHHPGWRATIDGVAAPVLRADHACLAVALPERERASVRLRFEPSSFRFGIWIALASVAGAWWIARARWEAR